MTNTYTKELAFAKKLALRAGEIMLKNFSKSTITIKANITPVTETDLAISHLVTNEIEKYFPTHSLIDEELQNKNDGAEFQWVCDPVDGTVPFSDNIPTSMFSLALCKNGEPVVAVMYDPYMKRLVYTTESSSSFMNNKKIRVNENQFLPGSTIYSIPYWLNNFDHNQFIEYFKKKDVIVSSVQSFVYLAMLIATGNISSALMPAASAWDRAASILIVKNAGGRITDEKGTNLTVFGAHNMCVASNSIVHDEILKLVNDCVIKK